MTAKSAVGIVRAASASSKYPATARSTWLTGTPAAARSRASLMRPRRRDTTEGGYGAHDRALAPGTCDAPKPTATRLLLPYPAIGIWEGYVTELRIIALTSYGEHTAMTGGRLRRDNLLSALAARGHHVARFD